MEITKQQLIDTIHHIGDKIDEMLVKSAKQEKKIMDLQSQNKELKKNNQATLDQIKEYIQELEQIRNHYVDSHNNTEQ
jgi:predicted  nucleic acid-binding Zn-ribbon protein